MERLKEWLWITLGCALFAVGVDIFARNAPFAPGGITGLSLIINHLLNVPIGIITLALNIPILIFCGKLMGKTFLWRSARTMVISVIFLDMVFPLFPHFEGEPIVAAIFSGVFMGGGLGLVYLHGSSTGGADFVIMAIKKLHPRLSLGQITLALDFVVISLGGIVFRELNAVLYGIICTFFTSAVIDKLMYGAGGGKLSFIITSDGMKTAEEISRKVGRGSTLFNGIGTYHGEERQMLLCVCSRREIIGVRNAAFSVDSNAFVAVSDVSEVMGLGFKAPEE